jgi:hypothetical protein
VAAQAFDALEEFRPLMLLVELLLAPARRR